MKFPWHCGQSIWAGPDLDLLFVNSRTSAMKILGFYKYFNQSQICYELTCAVTDWLKYL